MRHIAAVEPGEAPTRGDTKSGEHAVVARRRPLLLDVREPWEFVIAHLPGSVLGPLHSIPERVTGVAAQDDIVVTCDRRLCRFEAACALELRGFTSSCDLTGGLDAWAREVDPAMPKY
ncbi:rhodanese-like domain-containing protein [Accumulibacter sp.]|uniref:rhodanese-like domain-containing protein n=1 Tax=Accumulibacter sp. TaxID=2053492 RepID=UPI0025DA13CF|nr:rhodanese-like domain-containing protein [Accumulibacter sp.]MCM8593912.1 rhodanese-like domain-containing protein [Accumulibacter sp.]MCM8625554.1 rhodanese-like domain-containing protein [Accumulibacter sp.]MDS4048053.1 rhodanese-like domain-containing protein [Accumulibacter sp.]